jgi:HPt (histidine-containing phosphotransfer) domain-containing protein
MNASVNLNNLRDMTGNDAALEHELFEAFLDSSDECLEFLSGHCSAAAADDWRKRAHAWKGISLNLGAERLGQLCKNAQDNYRATAAEKLLLLADIREEYKKVKAYLEAL